MRLSDGRRTRFPTCCCPLLAFAFDRGYLQHYPKLNLDSRVTSDHGLLITSRSDQSNFRLLHERIARSAMLTLLQTCSADKDQLPDRKASRVETGSDRFLDMGIPMSDLEEHALLPESNASRKGFIRASCRQHRSRDTQD